MIEADSLMRQTAQRWQRTFRLIAALLLCLALGATGVAWAAGPTLVLSAPSGAPGASLVATGSGFERRATVTLTWLGTASGSQTVRARADGTFRQSMRIPQGAAAGDLTLQASSGSTLATTTVRVTGSATTAPTSTPVSTATAAATATKTPPPTATTTVAPTATAVRTPVPTQTSGGPAAGSAQERVHVLVNQARGQQGLPALTWNAALERAAQSYAQTMANTNCFSHSCPPVTEMTKRAENAGYTNWRNLGENIAAGYRTPDEVVQAWLNSPGHRANIMNSNFREVGVGVASGGSYGIYWAQEFGTR